MIVGMAVELLLDRVLTSQDGDDKTNYVTVSTRELWEED